LLLFSLSFSLSAQEELRPYKLINADQLKIDWIGNEYLTRLIGNVHFFYGKTEFFADNAEIYDVTKIAKMFGNVKVIEDSLALKSEKADYDQISEQLILKGKVFIMEDHKDGTYRTFFADKVHYMRDDKKLYAFDNVKFYDQREEARGESQYLDYDFVEGYGFINISPKIEVGDTEKVTITAEKVEFHNQFNRLSASFNVETTYDDYKVKSDFLLLFTEENYAVYLGQPSLTSNLADAEADKIYLYFNDKKMDRAVLEDNCVVQFALKEERDKNNNVYCNLMELYFENNAITKMYAEGNVRSVYTNDAEEDKDYFKNYAESEKLHVTFGLNNQIDTISFIGKVKGNYQFNEKNIKDKK
jgi:lipopolysaccharide assembly outer membrane protein LptD (OstA)